MFDRSPAHPEPNPDLAIDTMTKSIPNPNTADWFSYPAHAFPHQTDYGGIVWHGAYVAWLEEARVEYLRSLGVDYNYLVNLGYELPVVEMSLRYHLPVKLGMDVVIKTRMQNTKGVRIICDYQIKSLNDEILYLTAQVTLVAIESSKGKILRQLPSVVKDALVKLKTS
jgi:acyl-CoA thioester hydrolase